MDPYIYGFFALVYIVVLAWGIMKHEKTESAILFVVIIALIYDNIILALGHLIGAGETLKALSYWRFLLHAIFTPMLILFSLFILKEANIRFMQKKWVVIAFGLLTVTAMIAEYFFELRHLTLKVEETYGIVSYTSASSSGLPIMISLVIVTLLFASIILVWKRKWWWMLVGLIIMAVGGVFNRLFASNTVTNALELALVIALMYTAIHFSKNSNREPNRYY